LSTYFFYNVFVSLKLV